MRHGLITPTGGAFTALTPDFLGVAPLRTGVRVILFFSIAHCVPQPAAACSMRVFSHQVAQLLVKA